MQTFQTSVVGASCCFFSESEVICFGPLSYSNQVHGQRRNCCAFPSIFHVSKGHKQWNRCAHSEHSERASSCLSYSPTKIIDEMTTIHFGIPLVQRIKWSEHPNPILITCHLHKKKLGSSVPSAGHIPKIRTSFQKFMNICILSNLSENMKSTWTSNFHGDSLTFHWMWNNQITLRNVFSTRERHTGENLWKAASLNSRNFSKFISNSFSFFTGISWAEGFH